MVTSLSTPGKEEEDEDLWGVQMRAEREGHLS